MDSGIATDHRPATFAIEESVVDDYQLNPQAGWLYVVICRHINRKRNDAFPSLKRLAKLAGMSVPTVSKYIKHLESAGLIQVDRERNEDSKEHEVNHYHLLQATKVVKEHEGVVKEFNNPSKPTLQPVVKEVYSNLIESEPYESNPISKDKSLEVPLSKKPQTLKVLDKPKRQKKQAHPLFKDMQAAIQAAFRWETPTATEWGILGKAANSLLDANISLEQLPSLVGFCRSQWRDKLRPHHLSSNVSEWRKTQPKPTPVPVERDPNEEYAIGTPEEQQAEIERIIAEIAEKMNAPREKRTA